MTFSTSKRSYLASDNNREFVTSVKAVSAGETAIQLMLILSAQIYQEHFYFDLENDILVGVSDTGYINDELSYKYIQHFHR